jgi:Zn-dependent peptidase ImmA (M78 family)
MSIVPLLVVAARMHIRQADEDDRRRAERRRTQVASARATHRVRTPEPRPPLMVELANEYSQQTRPDLIAMCALAGVTVIHRDMRDDLAGYIDAATKSFVVNTRTTRERQRFTTAQMVAHWIWHRRAIMDHDGLNVGTDARSVPQAPYHNPEIGLKEERFSIRCATHLLMSADVVKRLHAEGRSTTEIATILAVSVRAAEIRLDGLGLSQNA